MTDSRSKGKRAELQAAEAVGTMLGVRFHRTQQYNGLGNGDIEPINVRTPLHFEVKHYRAGLTWWVKRSAETGMLVAKDLCYCRLEHLPGIIRKNYLAYASVTCGYAERWMQQATKDCKHGQIPVVVCKQDHSPWLVVWRKGDTDKVIEAFNGIRDAPVQV